MLFHYRTIAIKNGKIAYNEVKSQEFLTLRDFHNKLLQWNNGGNNKIQWLYAPCNAQGETKTLQSEVT